MAELVYDCPRCNANHTTFDVLGSTIIARESVKKRIEAFSVCRNCHQGTILTLETIDSSFSNSTGGKDLSNIGGSLTANKWVKVDGYVSIKDACAIVPPEHLPEGIRDAFCEGATCFSVGCYNAAGTMFRLCVDIATRSLLPDANDNKAAQPNSKQRRDLGLRLPWLFEQKLLPEDLNNLSTCIKEDGNDGAHAGNLEKVDVEDILDFTYALLERLYTERERVKLANQRRQSRRSPT